MTAQAGVPWDTNKEWEALDRQTITANVRRLQTRIVKAVKEGTWTKTYIDDGSPSLLSPSTEGSGD
jgi:hypothetical protein